MTIQIETKTSTTLKNFDGKSIATMSTCNNNKKRYIITNKINDKNTTVADGLLKRI